MNSYSPGRRPRRSRGGSRRWGDHPRYQETRAKAPKKTFWQRVAAFFGNDSDKGAKKPATASPNGTQPSRPAHKPESPEVSSPRLYVGNLSFDATESHLFELFNSIPYLQNAGPLRESERPRPKKLDLAIHNPIAEP